MFVFMNNSSHLSTTHLLPLSNLNRTLMFPPFPFPSLPHQSNLLHHHHHPPSAKFLPQLQPLHHQPQLSLIPPPHHKWSSQLLPPQHHRTNRPPHLLPSRPNNHKPQPPQLLIQMSPPLDQPTFVKILPKQNDMILPPTTPPLNNL